ncbi:ABC-type nickel/cobalt efflux system permease component RcnA [Rhodoligotrophos appendicifer]|uniref:nickel/cobalt transporter n=1 Tax=Rhodoligotrophos appendicifer TaxID=987056 RepID=UPI001186BF8E|nr:nickel/cobalt transporter [Rhodoligotrophos appendicifer]
MRGLVIALFCALSMFLAIPQTQAAPLTSEPLVLAQLVPAKPSEAEAAPRRLSWWMRAEIWLRTTQQGFYRELTVSLKSLKENWSVAAGSSLALVSFLYGIFHAAGPGHGKAVISAYLLANEQQLKRGIQLAFLSSLFQALSAIILVSIVLLLARAAFGTTRIMGYYLELASYALVVVMGALILWRAIRRLSETPRPALAAATVGQGGHHHDHHDHHAGHHHHDDHGHGDDCGCGHEHLPGPQATEGDWSLRRALAISFAVGIRPCSGALIVLIFASGADIYLAGIAATFAMALGTAITVTAIAMLAVGSRNLATKLSSGSARAYTAMTSSLAILGGLALVLIGVVLFAETITTPMNPLL